MNNVRAWSAQRPPNFECYASRAKPNRPPSRKKRPARRSNGDSKSPERLYGGTRAFADGCSAHPHVERRIGRQAVKTVMRWTGASEGTVRNWFLGSSGPNGQHLIALTQP